MKSLSRIVDLSSSCPFVLSDVLDLITDISIPTSLQCRIIFRSNDAQKESLFLSTIIFSHPSSSLRYTKV